MDSSDDQLKCVNCEIFLPFKKNDYIRCLDSICKKESVFLCAKCFSMGAECGSHIRSHPYKVEPATKTPVLPSRPGGRQWSTEEDEQLIVLASQYKCGAWDEVAKAIGHDVTSKEAMLRFDEHFIRGPMGRHAGSNKYWPYIDDRTGAFRVCQNSGTKGKQATGPSEWQYVVDGVQDWDDEIDFNDATWKEKIKEKLKQFKESYEKKACSLPVVESPVCNGVSDSTSSRSELYALLNGPPIQVTFTSASGRSPIFSPASSEHASFFEKAKSTVGSCNKRIISSSSDDIETKLSKRKWSETESNESAEIGLGPSTSQQEFSSPRKRSFVPYGMQSSDEEDLEDTLLSDEKNDKKCRIRQEAVRNQPKRKSRKRLNMHNSSAHRLEKVEELRDVITLHINEDDKRRLRSVLPFAFFNIHQCQSDDNEVLKAKSDDLQLLGYWPGRDDYDIEQNNDAERLISQITISPASNFEEEFENAVKMANIRSYNLTLAARSASKMMIREHHFVDLFFDKIKNVSSDLKNRGFVYNKEYRTMQRLCAEYAEFLKPLHQVCLKAELEELINSLAARETLLARVKELQKLKEAGVKNLPGHLKADLDNVKIIKKKRKTYNIMKRKGLLKYNRLKRWTQKHAESDD